MTQPTPAETRRLRPDEPGHPAFCLLKPVPAGDLDELERRGYGAQSSAPLEIAKWISGEISPFALAAATIGPSGAERRGRRGLCRRPKHQPRRRCVHVEAQIKSDSAWRRISFIHLLDRGLPAAQVVTPAEQSDVTRRLLLGVPTDTARSLPIATAPASRGSRCGRRARGERIRTGQMVPRSAAGARAA